MDKTEINAMISENEKILAANRETMRKNALEMEQFYTRMKDAAIAATEIACKPFQDFIQ